ncbi:MAG TPA: GNAT family N-acetyltransferase [Thermoplasmata archaeon]|nr:GNAT family N-acetyltransferase [Thermoplasmata archaeon]
MEIRAIDTLPAELEGSWGSLVWSDGSPPLDRALYRKARSLGVPFSDYTGVLAIDAGEVLAQIVVGRLRLTTRRESETFAAIEDVCTRPDAIGRGLSSLLFREVHDRETRARIGLSLLWTRRSWGAHRLYEKLGYRDVYSPGSAVLPPPPDPSVRLPAGFTTRRVRRSELGVLEGLLARAHRGRIGFVDRFRDSFRARVALGWRSAKDFHLLLRASRPVGYFYATEEGRRQVGIYEAVVPDRRLQAAMLDAIRSYAGRRWVTLGTSTFVRDAAGLLREKGFLLRPESHIVLMARSLTGAPTSRTAELRRLMRDPRFFCHGGDMF